MTAEQREAFELLTIDRLMCMSVEGFPFRAEGDDYLKFALSCPLVKPEERSFCYSNIPAYLVGVALSQAIGGCVGVFGGKPPASATHLRRVL